MSLKRYLARRLVYAGLSAYALATILFFLFRLIPGNPTSTFIAQGMSKEARQQLIERWGLNEPLHIQYYEYIEGLFTLDFGESLYYQIPISELIVDRLVNTAVLMVPGIIIGVSIGVTLGAVYGWNRGNSIERGGIILSLLGRSVPIFFSGVVLQYVFAGGLWDIFPSGGMTTATASFASPIAKFTSMDFLAHLVLPLAVTVIWYSATPTLIMRAGMLETLNKEFMNTYRSWGVDDIHRLFYASKHGSLPVITYLAVLSGYMFGGQVVVEQVFSWPGMGRLLVDAVYRQDLPLLETTFFLMGVLIILLNLVVDMLYVYIDPRITYE